MVPEWLVVGGAGIAVLMYPKQECFAQSSKVAAVVTTSAAACAKAFKAKHACETGAFMFSTAYPSWRCRCCGTCAFPPVVLTGCT